MEVLDQLKNVFDQWTLLHAMGIWLLLRLLKSTPLDGVTMYRRILPFLPEIIGVSSALLGGLPLVADQGLPIKIAGGLWCAYLAKGSRKFLAQTVLGIDPKIEANQKSAAALAAELTEKKG